MRAADPLTVLTVKATENDGVTRFGYELRTSPDQEYGALEEEYSPEINRQLVDKLCAKADQALKDAVNGEVAYYDDLVGVGRMLYSHLFPLVRGSDEPALVTRIRESRSPLLIRGNDTSVPWELLHDGTEFLGLHHDVGQSAIGQRAALRGRDVTCLDKALVIGDPLDDLPAARREAEHIADWLGQHGTECTLLLGEKADLADVVTELSSRPYDLLHYSGHVTIKNSRPGDSGLLLHRRNVLDERALRTAARIGAPPMVFINGCSSAGPTANLCVSFMAMGAKIVVGTRAEVIEEGAQQFAEAFYQRILSDETAGAAMRAARLAVKHRSDGAWASFLLYGNPGAHITGASTTQSHKPDPGVRPYSAEAAMLMNNVHAVARRHGGAISLHLLLGLVTSADLKPSIEKSIGADRLETVTAMLYGFAGVLPGGDDHATTNGRQSEAELSDTVHAVLVEAEATVATKGRHQVTPRDIADAFVDIGGGSSAEVLAAFGLSVGELLAPDAAGTGARQPEPGILDLAGTRFDDRGVLRADALDDATARATTAALWLAAVDQTAIGTHIYLQGFALAGSAVLRAALEKQGDVGSRAVRQLFPAPRRTHFSRRSLTALAAAGTPADEATLLAALLADEGSAARQLLARLGVDAERLVQDLNKGE